jgi:hypothetical protein
MLANGMIRVNLLLLQANPCHHQSPPRANKSDTYYYDPIPSTVTSVPAQRPVALHTSTPLH